MLFFVDIIKFKGKTEGSVNTFWKPTILSCKLTLTAAVYQLYSVPHESVPLKVNTLRQRLPKDVYVYVSGSTTFYDKHSEDICR